MAGQQRQKEYLGKQRNVRGEAGPGGRETGVLFYPGGGSMAVLTISFELCGGADSCVAPVDSSIILEKVVSGMFGEEKNTGDMDLLAAAMLTGRWQLLHSICGYTTIIISGDI